MAYPGELRENFSCPAEVSIGSFNPIWPLIVIRLQALNDLNVFVIFSLYKIACDNSLFKAYESFLNAVEREFENSLYPRRITFFVNE